MPVSILRWQRSATPRRAAAACSARAAPGVEIVGVRSCSNTPSRSLTLSAPKTRIGARTPAWRSTIAFLDVGAREHRGAGLLERARHLRRAVPVGVGLDDGDDAGRGPVGGGEIGGNRATVAANRVEIDAGDGRPDHGDPCARFSKRVYSLMNASLAVPVGPFRCLPMMISATPCAS